MAASDAPRIFLPGHFKSISYHLHGARPGNEAAAKGNVVGEHVLDAAIGIFNIFADDRNINWYPGFTENSVNAVKCLKSSFIGVSVPCFTCGYVDALHPFSLRCFHGSFEQYTQTFYGLKGFGGHAIVEAFIKNPLPHVNKFILKWYIRCLEDL
jgi:hypothetical protein